MSPISTFLCAAAISFAVLGWPIPTGVALALAFIGLFAGAFVKGPAASE